MPIVIGDNWQQKIKSKGFTERDAKRNAEKEDPSLIWRSGRFNGKKEFCENPEYIDFRTLDEMSDKERKSKLSA